MFLSCLISGFYAFQSSFQSSKPSVGALICWLKKIVVYALVQLNSILDQADKKSGKNHIEKKQKNNKQADY